MAALDWTITKKWTEGKFVGFIFPKCNKEDYAPEGEPLHAIVDDFADNQSVWFEEFIPALEKNGRKWI